MFGERDDPKKKMDAEFAERNTCQNREDNHSWYASQREVKAQKKIQYEEEKTRRDKEGLWYSEPKDLENFLTT